MSKKTRPARPRAEKKAEKPVRKPRVRRAPTKMPPAKPAEKPVERPAEKPVEKEHEPAERYLVAIRIDGTPNVKPPEELTLNSLRMKSRYSTVLLRDDPSVRGMLQRIKDHVTWAEAKKEDITLLLSSRARTSEGLGLTSKFVKKRSELAGVSEVVSNLQSGELTLAKLREMGIEPCFRLHPPRGGFPRSSKRPFADSGELGFRKEGLHKLLVKMC
ncbi:MAG TPA: 50S ribosomal protein L30 [Candidatus Acidoferrum sp.]|nr:50S ribosomal protein L30 [Candidatus Acidoferrum sp.]